jgi:hypothetical protein
MTRYFLPLLAAASVAGGCSADVLAPRQPAVYLATMADDMVLPAPMTCPSRPGVVSLAHFVSGRLTLWPDGQAEWWYVTQKARSSGGVQEAAVTPRPPRGEVWAATPEGGVRLSESGSSGGATAVFHRVPHGLQVRVTLDCFPSELEGGEARPLPEVTVLLRQQ